MKLRNRGGIHGYAAHNYTTPDISITISLLFFVQPFLFNIHLPFSYIAYEFQYYRVWILNSDFTYY